LSDAGYDVVLVDADLGMANLADVLGETAESGIHAVLAEEAAVDDVILENEGGPDVVPGGETIDHFQAADPSNLTRVLAPLEAAYDLVLVDTGAGLCHETLVAAGLAHGTVLVTTPQDAAVADVAKTAEVDAPASVDRDVADRIPAGGPDGVSAD
jgi:septum site-determining protein MinD